MSKVVDIAMKLRTWKYYINQGLRGIFKNGLMSFASIIIVSACIFIVILSLCIITNVDYMLTQIESEIGVTLFLGDTPEQEDVDSLITELKNMSEVSSVTYKSSEEALEDAKDMYTAELLEGLADDNPLPRSIEVRLKDIKYQKSFIKKAEQLQIDFEKQILGITDEDLSDDKNVEEQTTAHANESAALFSNIVYAEEATAGQPAAEAVTQAASAAATQAVTEAVTQAATEAVTEAQTETTTKAAAAPKIGDSDYEYKGIELISHAQQITETLLTIDTAFKIVSIVLIIILGVVSIGIIMNTIKLTVFIRKTEIGIMKYVGATDWFIRWPFIIEGVIIGLIGAIIPSIICTLGYLKLYDFFNSDYTILKGIAQLKPTLDIFSLVIPISLLLGMLIGAIGSISSIRRHLNV